MNIKSFIASQENGIHIAILGWDNKKIIPLENIQEVLYTIKNCNFKIFFN